MRKKRSNQGYKISVNYTPAVLPGYGLQLDGYITRDYSLSSESFLRNCYRELKEKLSSLIQRSDRYTVAHGFDSIVDGEMSFAEARHLEEVAAHELQGEHIKAAREVRKEALDRQINEIRERMEQTRDEIVPLQGLQAQHELKLGELYIPMGLPVTLAAMLIDGLLNYSFLEGILLSNVFLLFITVLGLSILSDGTMFFLGIILSHRKENYMGKWLFRVAVAGFTSLFVFSAAACVFIKFGSMDITFGSISAAGTFVGKESYSMAEYAATAITAVITTATGLISLVVSVDEHAHQVSRRRTLEKILEKDRAQYELLKAERNALEYAVDPMIYDVEKRRAAEANLEALRIGLKQYVYQMLALQQADPDYTDVVLEAAGDLLEEEAHAEAGDAQNRRPITHLRTKTACYS